MPINLKKKNSGCPNYSPQFNDAGQSVNDWVCEHRWPEIQGLVKLRNSIDADSFKWTSWWDNGKNQIAFTIGAKAFFAFNKENCDMKVKIATSLPCGVYCDIISGGKVNNKCTGISITVDKGYAQFTLCNSIGVAAIYIDSKL